MITLALRNRGTLTSLLLIAPGLALLAPTSSAGANGPNADSKPAAHQDRSGPLRSTPAQHDSTETSLNKMAHSDENDASMPQRPAPAHDPVVQSSQPAVAAPATTASFDGVGNGFSGPQGTYTVNSAPPDTNSAVGPTQIVEIVNQAFAVFNKTGPVAYGPANTNTLWRGFGGPCETTNDGDGVVRYDSIADRWIITQFANVRSASGPYYECFAVSQTGDATGAYNRYSFLFTNFPDYPKLGVWPDAYYMTYNLFNGNSFAGAEVCAMDRAKMLAGAAATQQCFTTSTSYGGLLPADFDGHTLPPSSAPALILATGTTAATLAAWNFHVDWVTPGNSTFTGPTNVAIASYTAACGGGTCIPQSGTSNKLDSLADRLMFRLAYRNFGDHEAWVVSHSVTAGSSTGVRWYELRPSGSTVSVYQQSTYAPDATYRWMPSIAMDKAGNIGLGYSTSSSSLHPGIAYTGRLAGDTLGVMTQGEGAVITGRGSQTGTLHRWGDYSSMSVDPADDCTFWYSTEYIPANGSFNWHTRLASFAFPSCLPGTTTDDFSIAASPTSGSVQAGSSVNTTVSTALTTGAAQTITLSATGLPFGATASFAPASVSSGDSSTLTISTTSTTAAGTSTVTITGTGGSATHSTSYSFTVNAIPSSGAINNGGFETGSLYPWSFLGTTSISTGTPHGGAYSAQDGSSAPTNGTSSIVQSFTAPSGVTKLSFWYSVSCPDTVRYDWATATLKDTTTGKTRTVLPKTCTNGQGWKNVQASIVTGHNYTLTLSSKDDNYATDPTFTRYDDVTLL